MFVQILSSESADRTICPTSAIRDIDISTDAPSLRVSLTDGADEIYAAVLYAYSGKVTLADAGAVIEQWMRLHGLHRADITVRACCASDSSVFATMTVSCLYCSYVVPESFDFTSTFYTAFRAHRVPPDAKFPIYGPVTEADPVLVNIAGVDADGAPASGSVDLMASDGYVGVDVKAWTDHVCSHTSVARPCMMSIRCRGMETTLLIVRDPQYLGFVFRNGFNCREPVWISGVSVLKPEVSADSVICSGRLMEYNRVLTRTYEHTSGPLTRAEAVAMLQMLESYSAGVLIDGKFVDIVITDRSTEVSADDATLNVLKFSWQFADRRLRLFGEDLDSLLYSSGIFTEQFQTQYM